MLDANFWQNKSLAQKVIKEKKFHENLINSYERLSGPGLSIELPFNNSAALVCFSGATSYVKRKVAGAVTMTEIP